jgi:16S rRNA (cytosine1402-N4)-methyltransferase
MSKTEYHIPVLLHEAVDGLAIKPDGVYVDVTFGGGGHSAEILKQLGENGRLLGFDQDPDAEENIPKDNRFTFIAANFKYLKQFLKMEGHRKVDGILGDFGVSSHQFDVPDRGFSTRFDGPLDMRMDTDQELSAAVVVNTYSQQELQSIFWENAQLKNSRRLAETIISARQVQKIKTSKELTDLLYPLLFKGKQNKVLAQIFQAIRIEVNQELKALKDFLNQTEQLLNPGGRLSLISYHSLEDRLVKRYIRSGLFEGEPKKDFYGNIEVPFKKVGKLIKPAQTEIEQNRRARSARLRIGERIN